MAVALRHNHTYMVKVYKGLDKAFSLFISEFGYKICNKNICWTNKKINEKVLSMNVFKFQIKLCLISEVFLSCKLIDDLTLEILFSFCNVHFEATSAGTDTYISFRQCTSTEKCSFRNYLKIS